MAAPQASPEKELPAPMVDYTEFQGPMLTCITPQSKSFDLPNGQKGQYHETAFNYNYGTAQEPRVDGFYYQYPKVKSDGVRKQASEKGYDQWSMKFTFDLTDLTNKACVEALALVHHRMANCIAHHRGIIGIPHFSPENPEATGFKGLVYWPFDKATAEVIQGKNPTQFHKLNKGTLFTDLNGSPIPWEVLIDADIEGYPLIHYSHVYSSGNGKATSQSRVASMVIMSVVPRNTQTRQTATIDRIVSNDPNAVNKLEEQIALLMSGRQDALAASAHPPQSAPQPQLTAPAQQLQLTAPQQPAPPQPAQQLAPQPQLTTPPQPVPQPQLTTPQQPAQQPVPPPQLTTPPQPAQQLAPQPAATMQPIVQTGQASNIEDFLNTQTPSVPAVPTQQTLQVPAQQVPPVTASVPAPVPAPVQAVPQITTLQ